METNEWKSMDNMAYMLHQMSHLLREYKNALPSVFITVQKYPL